MLKSLPAIFILSIILQSCYSITRTEEDVYTRTSRDTTYVNYVHQDPRNEDNGVVKPSKRVLIHERKQVLQDSVVQREYPDFIRIGLFEAAGFIWRFISIWDEQWNIWDTSKSICCFRRK